MSFLKGSLLASFFIVFSVHLQALPGSARLQWQALLHLNNDTPLITSSIFLLSAENFSVEQEWNLTRALFQQQPEAICRFPARYQLMRQYESLPSFPECPDYQKFLAKAPVDNISIIYASENLTNPSSMMGHGMLSISGYRDDGFYTNHAVSFFTELDSYNPLKVIWETVVVGKEGYFLVKPLNGYVDFYNQTEQRNVWRYILDLDEPQKQLIQAHLWELKHPQIDYFFDDHNCATLSLDILRIVEPDLPAPDIVSPLDLAKIVSQSGLVKHTEVTPADKWKIRMLNETAGIQVTAAASEFRKSGKLPADIQQPEQRFLFKQLSTTLLDYDWNHSEMSLAQYKKQKQALADYQTEALFLDIDAYRSPLKTAPDSQLASGWLDYRDESWLTLRWLPAAHTLEDDNREYFGENELRLNDVELRFSPTKKALQLHRWQLYSAASLTPRDSLIGGLSGHFQLGFKPVYDQELEANTGFSMSGGLGMTEAIGSDLRMYALLNAGVEAGPTQTLSYLQPELGGYLYEIWDMKSRFSYKPQFRSDGKRLHYWTFDHTFSGQHSALIAKAELLNLDSAWQRSWQLEWRWYY